MTSESAMIGILKPITTYALVPIWFALLLYIITEILCIKKGISLREEVHQKNFGLVAATALLWLIAFWVPEKAYMPMNVISFRLLFIILAIIATIHFIVFYFSEMLAPNNTLRELGTGAGLSSSRHAVMTAAKMCKKDEDLTNDGAATIMMASTTTVLRNFLILTITGIVLNAFKFPPLFFWISMLSMFIICLVSHFLFNWRSSKAEAPEYSFFSPKNTIFFMIIVLVVFYLSIFAQDKLGFTGLYALTGLTGIIYGGAPIFVLLALMLTGKITVMIALYAAIIASSACIVSNIFYSYIAGAKKLSWYLSIAGAAAIFVGIGLMLILA